MTTKRDNECVRCPHGRLQLGRTTLTVERDETTLVFKDVPARVCDTCGEAYLDGATLDQLQNQLDAALKAGVEVDVRRYKQHEAA